MSKVNDGGPAFPLVKQKIGYHADVVKDSEGLSIRDYFAANVIAGICASGPTRDFTNEILAREAYAIADAMLKERAKG